jgi:DNA-binding GntR family transcriptional regulator
MAFSVPLTRTEAVYRQLRTEIMTNELTPGALIKDAEIAGRLGVSITPVREAVARLAVEGLIDTASSRYRHVTQMSPDDALELLDVKAVLTCTGFEWGVERLAPAHVARLRIAYEEFAASLGRDDLSAAAEAGAEFSRIVVSACGNRELLAQIELLMDRAVRAVMYSTADTDWNVWSCGYREVLEFIECGDREKAVNRYRRIYADHRARLESVRAA